MDISLSNAIIAETAQQRGLSAENLSAAAARARADGPQTEPPTGGGGRKEGGGTEGLERWTRGVGCSGRRSVDGRDWDSSGRRDAGRCVRYMK